MTNVGIVLIGKAQPTCGNLMAQAPVPIGKNRSRFEIMSKMLDIAIQGSKSTRLMYGGNLSYTQFRLYLNFLLNNGFLVTYRDGGSLMYKTTEKGMKFLRAVNEIDNLLSEGKELNAEIAW